MVENPLSVFWNSLNNGNIDWNIFYEKLDDSKRKEATGFLIKREFVLSSSEKVEDMTFSSECNTPKKYVVKYERGRILNPANSINLQETLYFIKERYAEQYMGYLLRTSLEKSQLELEVKEMNYNLINKMRSDGLSDFYGESSDNRTY